MRALIDHHLHLDSALHRWHPTCKLAGAGVVALATAGVNSVAAAGACVVLALLMVLLGRLPARLVWSRVMPVAGFLVVLAVLLALSTSPRDAALGGVGFSTAGLRLGCLIGLKCLAIVVLSVVALATTATVQVFKSARSLAVPGRLVEILLLAYRLIFALSEEMDSLRRAASCRGFVPGVAPRQLRHLGRLTGSLLARGFDRSDRLYNAMLARGYDGTVRALAPPPAQAADYAKLAMSFLVAMGLVATRWW